MLPAMSNRPNATQHRTNGDPTIDRTGLVGVSVAEAAERLGLSTEAVRMRLKRRTLPGDRDDAGHWRVWLSADEQVPNTDLTPSQQSTSQATHRDLTTDPTPANALLDHLRDEVNFLRGQLADTQAALDQRSRELAAERERFDVLHREALARIPALGSGQDTPQASPAAHHGSEGVAPVADRPLRGSSAPIGPPAWRTSERPPSEQVPWWRRWWERWW